MYVGHKYLSKVTFCRIFSLNICPELLGNSNGELVWCAATISKISKQLDFQFAGNFLKLTNKNEIMHVKNVIVLFFICMIYFFRVQVVRDHVI